MPEITVTQAFAQAAKHFEIGEFAHAESICRQILAHQPNQLEALHLLGVLAQQAGHHKDAVELTRHAIRVRPDVPEFHNTLGNALSDAGDVDQAIQAYETALSLRQNMPDVWCNLGLLFLKQHQIEKASQAFQTALRFNPRSARAHMGMGDALSEAGNAVAATPAYKTAIQCDPKLERAYARLGIALQKTGLFEDAVNVLNAALRLNPNSAPIYNDLGTVFQDLEQHDNAILAFQQAIRLNPSYAIPYNNMGNAMLALQRFDEALSAYREAIRLNPDLAEAHANFGGALFHSGATDSAIAEMRRSIQLNPNSSQFHSELLYSLSFQPAATMEVIRDDCQLWNARFAEPLRQSIPAYKNDRDPDRRLKIGYVSPDFYWQAECFFVLPLLESHDRSQFEIHCYSSVRNPDELTARYRKTADAWHEVRQLTDGELADKIRADGIDILVDLTMHMLRNRMPLFARKPAPVQFTWLAYPGTTGVRTIDYRLTDAFMDPPGDDESWSSEKPIRLPDSWCCFEPIAINFDVAPLPARTNGNITFGSFNNFCKVNPPVIALWAKVLLAIPGSRLMLLCPAGSHRQELLNSFGRQGITADRIELVPKQTRPEYLKLYQKIDIALDPFPYNGITTTCDSLFMGVPVISLCGDRPAWRAGASILTTVGVPELVARNDDGYVKIAVDLASDLSRLEQLRHDLRPRMQASPLMDFKRFAQNVESAYRDAWRRYVNTISP